MYYEDGPSWEKRKQAQLRRTRDQLFHDERYDLVVREAEGKFNPFLPEEPEYLMSFAKKHAHDPNLRQLIPQEAKRLILSERYAEMKEILCNSIPKDLAVVIIDFYCLSKFEEVFIDGVVSGRLLGGENKYTQLSGLWKVDPCAYRDGQILISSDNKSFLVSQHLGKMELAEIHERCIPYSLVSNRPTYYTDAMKAGYGVLVGETDAIYPLLTCLQRNPLKTGKILLVEDFVYAYDDQILWWKQPEEKASERKGETQGVNEEEKKRIEEAGMSETSTETNPEVEVLMDDLVKNLMGYLRRSVEEDKDSLEDQLTPEPEDQPVPDQKEVTTFSLDVMPKGGFALDCAMSRGWKQMSEVRGPCLYNIDEDNGIDPVLYKEFLYPRKHGTGDSGTSCVRFIVVTHLLAMKKSPKVPDLGFIRNLMGVDPFDHLRFLKE